MRRFKDSKSVTILDLNRKNTGFEEEELRNPTATRTKEENLQLKMKTSFCFAEAESHLRRRFKTYPRDGSTHHGLTENSLPSIIVNQEFSPLPPSSPSFLYLSHFFNLMIEFLSSTGIHQPCNELRIHPNE